MTYEEMRKLSFTARHDLWRRLNQTAPQHIFLPLVVRSELPKAIRTILPPSDSKSPSKEALWCPYCGDWMKFRVFSYTGYEKCIGCSISTADFYVAKVNKLAK